MTIKEITMNYAQIAVESHEERLTLNKSNDGIQNDVIDVATNLSYVISQRKWTEYFIRIVRKQKPEPYGLSSWLKVEAGVSLIFKRY